jgi:hypothetical protein
MKKFIALSLLGVLIIAFSATVYAQKLDMRISGFIDAQSIWDRNVTRANPAGGIYQAIAGDYKVPNAGAFNKTEATMESRARLKFDAFMDKNLSGTIFFEMDSTPWGNTSASGNQRNQYGYWSGDRAAVEIKNVYIDFGLPYFGIPVPMTMRVGLQPLSIRNNLLVYTDGMGITAGIDVNPLMIQPLWFKALEGKDARSDDADVYGLHANVKINTVTIGGYGLYYDMKSYPFFGDPPPAYGLPATNNFAKMWWLGAYMDGKLGPVNLNLDFIYDTGKVESRTAGIKDVDYDGMVGYLKIDYPWQLFNFGLVAMYASGADAEKTGASGLAGSLTSTGVQSSKVKAYVVPPGSEAGAIFGESLVVYSTWVNRGDAGIGNTLNYTQMSRGPVGGTWLAKLYGSYKIAPWYKMTLAVLYIGDTTKNGDTLGYSRNPDGTLDDNKSIGWEFDLYNEFQIYKNLKYTVAGGILAAGDALKYYQSADCGNTKLKTPWTITTNLTYNF